MLNFRTYKIYRLQNPEESGESGASDYKLAFQDTGFVITGHLDKATPEFSAIVDGVYGKTFRFFSDSAEAEIRIGDRIVRDSDPSELYEVKGDEAQTDGPLRRREMVVIKLQE